LRDEGIERLVQVSDSRRRPQAHGRYVLESVHSEAAIRTEGLTKRYGSTLALDRLDLTIGPGDVYGFLGPKRRVLQLQ
jgi:hypothetical protein